MLHFKTRDGSSSNDKSWVFLCISPEEAQIWLTRICEDIFQFCNCAIWYDDNVETSFEDLESAIAQSTMTVLPVTAALLDPDSAIQRQILPLLQTHRVSILPVLDDPNLLDAFNARFRSIQVLDRYSKDQTAIPYEEKLKRFLDSMLLGDVLAERVRQAFRAQIFLSYRKKDRSLALDLVKQFHKNPQCRSISLWYDEFLTPGEDFDGNIALAIQDSNLFLLALTQNMVKEDNYVIQSEYPIAQRAGKKILPVLLESVDFEQVQTCFPGISSPIDRAEAVRYLAQYMGDPSDSTPEQIYLLGLAFLHGLYVERQVSLGLEQLECSAQRGYAPAALQLANIQILEYNPDEQKARKLRWLRKYAALTCEAYTLTPNTETAQQYADALDRAAEAEFEQHPDVAFVLYEQAIALLEKHDRTADRAQICSNYGLKLVAAGKNQDGLQMLLKALTHYAACYREDPAWSERHAARFSYCYYNTGNAAVQAGELKVAEAGYTSAIRNFTVLAQKQPEEYTLVLAQAYGNLANVYRRLWIRTGDPEQCARAEAHHIRAIEILNSVIEWAPKTYEPAFALELASLSAIYLDKPDYNKAEIALNSAIRILQAYEEMYPCQYTDTLAHALGNRAILFFSQDKLDRAREDFDTTITLFRRVPHRHMELAKALWNMANTYTMEENFDQARHYYEEAVTIYESGIVQGSEHSPDFAQCCHNFAKMHYQSGAYPESLTWVNRAVEIYCVLQGGTEEAYVSQLEDLRCFAEWLVQRI